MFMCPITTGPSSMALPVCGHLRLLTHSLNAATTDHHSCITTTHDHPQPPTTTHDHSRPLNDTSRPSVVPRQLGDAYFTAINTYYRCFEGSEAPVVWFPPSLGASDMLLTKHLVEHSVPFSYLDVTTVIVRLRRKAREWCGEQLRPFLLQCLFTSTAEDQGRSCQDHNNLGAACACERKFGAVDQEAGLVTTEVEVDGIDGGQSEDALGPCAKLKMHDAEWRESHGESSDQVGFDAHADVGERLYEDEDDRTPRGAVVMHTDSLGVIREVRLLANVTPVELHAAREELDGVRALYARMADLGQGEAGALSKAELELELEERELELERGLADQIRKLTIATQPIFGSVIDSYHISL
mmetsp:Transcript_42773/g.114835  ORF Transcript_42773/g.114835 Transcript_42773/m.114835 type:complete len:355 (+) Transcript_42773:564-1628(+)